MKRMWALALISGLGCVDLKESYPDWRYYSMEVVRTGASRTGDTKAVLRVRRFSASQMYDGREMVTRTGESTYESDYYNVLFIPPAVQVGEQTRRWLQGSGLFGHVVGTGSSVGETQTLEGNLVSLYGDYRNPEAPNAFIEVQFVLVNVAADPVSVRFQKTYRQEIPVEKRDPAMLVKGWDEGLRRILVALEEDLAKGSMGLERRDASPPRSAAKTKTE
jgi:ABC-type uncharacterized transport system auxiliary subunit